MFISSHPCLFCNSRLSILAFFYCRPICHPCPHYLASTLAGICPVLNIALVRGRTERKGFFSTRSPSPSHLVAVCAAFMHLSGSPLSRVMCALRRFCCFCCFGFISCHGTQARAGEITNMTGIAADAPYEAPENPEIRLLAEGCAVDVCADKLLSYLRERGYLQPSNPIKDSSGGS